MTSLQDRSREYSSEYRTEAYEDDGDQIEEEYIEETRTINERFVTKRHGYGGATQDEFSTRRQGYGAHDEYSARRGYDHHHQEQQSRRGGMAVDYSSQDFRQSLAAIDAASRDGVISRDGVRVRQQGDTTIMTEHRDPYSFYWQLDQHRRRSESPKRKPPPTDYVIDEEEVIETVLSPESHDSGVAFENQYSRPLRVTPPAPPPAPPPPPPPVIEEEHRPLPPGWEKHQDPSGFSYYWHVDSGTIQREPPVCLFFSLIL
ncbi:hypothetical protein Aduo_010232 [Ancylostoma duodenale]